MHSEDYLGLKPTSRTSVSTTTSQYTAEYFAKIRWVFRELFSKLSCKSTVADWAVAFSKRIISLHVAHTSLLKSNNSHNRKIVEDLEQLQYTISQSLSLITADNEMTLFEELNAFKYKKTNEEQCWN
jgi:two-component sensor histidine kinase